LVAGDPRILFDDFCIAQPNYADTTHRECLAAGTEMPQVDGAGVRITGRLIDPSPAGSRGLRSVDIEYLRTLTIRD
jgi:hypothetical protein